jgi:transposase
MIPGVRQNIRRAALDRSLIQLMAKSIWSPAQNRKLLGMYKSGTLSTSEMADKLEVSIPTVYNHLRRLGLKTTSLPRRYRAAIKFEFSATEKRRIVQLAREGHKVSQIALQIKRTTGPTRRVFRELGLTSSVAKPLTAGQRFGALTVLGAARPQLTYKGHHESRSLVICDCGKKKTLFNYLLRTRNSTSCGCRIQQRKPEAVWIRLRCQIESGARVRGLEMSLTIEQLKYLCSLPCSYCKSPAMNKMKGRRGGRSTAETVQHYSGVDRVDSTKGYIPGNVIPCCRICNRAKSNLDLEQFIEWLVNFGSALTAADIQRVCAEVENKLRDS